MKQSLFSLIALLVLTTGCQQQPPQDVLAQPRDAVLQSGPEILPVLEKALGDDSPMVRGKAAVRLGLWAGHKGNAEQKESALETLRRALGDDQISVQLEVLAGLADIGPEAILAIAKGLKHEDSEVRVQTVGSAVKAAQGGAVKTAIDSKASAAMMAVLHEAFQDEDPRVRASVAHGIGFLGVRGTNSKFIPVQDLESQVDAQSTGLLIEILEKGLNDGAVEVCQEAGVSAWQFGSEKVSMLEKALSSENASARRGVLLALAELPLTEEAIGRLMPAFSERDRPSTEELAKTSQLFERGFQDKDLLVRLAAAETAIVFEPDAVRPEVIADIGKAAELGDPAMWHQNLRKLTDQVAQKGTPEQKAGTANDLESLLQEADRSTAEDILLVFSKMGPQTLPVLERVLESDRADMHMMAVGCVGQMFDNTRRGYDSQMYMTKFGSDDEAKAMRVVEQALKHGDLEVQLLAAETGIVLRSQPPPAGIVPAIEAALRAEELDLTKQLPRITSLAVYVGRNGDPDQKAAILRALEDVADDASPKIKAATERAAQDIQQPRGQSR